MFTLETPIEQLPATSPLTIKRLKSLKIATFEDLLNYFPFRYENYSLVSTINRLQAGEKVTIKGRVTAINSTYTKRGLTLQKIRLTDETGSIDVIWYNQPYLLRLIRPQAFLNIAGDVQWFDRVLILLTQQYELITNSDSQTIHTGRLIPIYPEIRGLSSKTIREKVWYALTQKVPDEFFPQEFVKQYHLVDESAAYQKIHFPKNMADVHAARHRLSFDEISIIQLCSHLVKKEWQKQQLIRQFTIDQQRLLAFIKHLPFRLTNAQTRCLNEIIHDLSQKHPMNRLLQGEVGSGKTVVAAAGAYVSFQNQGKTLFLAPTEILAAQHYQTLGRLFNKNTAKPIPQITLYTAGSKPTPKELQKADIVVGTHALIERKVSFKQVGLVIIDEQHKFGVAQRAELKAKGVNPHLLTMTATPIPRTVVLTLYGELDLSVIDEMPPGRAAVKTYVVPLRKRIAAYEWMKKMIKQEGSQVYIVCPLIEESEKETLATIKAVKKEFDHLKTTVFPDCCVGLLHGKMKTTEKNSVMKDFSAGKIDILVSTSVVEVGIDVPTARIILIEACERFGLAQLHQLRGRVGRGDKQSYCLLFTEKETPAILQRLNLFSRVKNGFELAEYDLKMRGAGEIYGTQQHGAANLKIASLTDAALIQQTKTAVGQLTAQHNLADFPLLQKRLQNYKISLIARD